MEYSFKYPKNLDIDTIVEDTMNDTIKNKQMHKEELLFIISSLYILSSKYYYDLDDNDDNQFVPLSSKLLRIGVPYYNKYIELLLLEKIIESDFLSIKGKKCTGYCFSGKYLGQDYHEYWTISPQMKSRIRRQQKFIEDKDRMNVRGYSNLVKWCKNGKLKIDKEAAYNWIENDRIFHIQNIAEETLKWDSSDKKSSFKLSERKINQRAINFRLQVDNFNGNNRCKFSGEGHRLYNSLTSLKSELRNFVTYDSNELVNLDIKNSQPFIAILFHTVTFWEKYYNELKKEDMKIKKKQKNLVLSDKEIKEIKMRMNKIDKIEAIIMLLKNAKTRTSKRLHGNDLVSYDEYIKYYIDQVTCGTFYQEIKTQMERFFPERFDNKDKVKKETLRMFYSDNRKNKFPLYWPNQVFEKLYPPTYKIFDILKSVQCEYKDNFLPIFLQKLESDILIGKICKTVSLNYPRIPMFTIHDSIVTTVGNEDIVASIMHKILEEEIGYAPIIDRKILTVSGVSTTAQNFSYTSTSTQVSQEPKAVSTSTIPYKVVDTATGEMFATIKHAAESFGKNYNTYRNMLSGSNKNTTSLLSIGYIESTNTSGLININGANKNI